MCVNLFKFGICWVHGKINKMRMSGGKESDIGKCRIETRKREWVKRPTSIYACLSTGRRVLWCNKKITPSHIYSTIWNGEFFFRMCVLRYICNLKIILINFTYRKAKHLLKFSGVNMSCEASRYEHPSGSPLLLLAANNGFCLYVCCAVWACLSICELCILMRLHLPKKKKMKIIKVLHWVQSQ